MFEPATYSSICYCHLAHTIINTFRICFFQFGSYWLTDNITYIYSIMKTICCSEKFNHWGSSWGLKSTFPWYENSSLPVQLFLWLIKIKFRLTKLEQTIIVTQLIATHSYSVYSLIHKKYWRISSPELKELRCRLSHPYKRKMLNKPKINNSLRSIRVWRSQSKPLSQNCRDKQVDPTRRNLLRNQCQSKILNYNWQIAGGSIWTSLRIKNPREVWLWGNGGEDTFMSFTPRIPSSFS